MFKHIGKTKQIRAGKGEKNEVVTEHGCINFEPNPRHWFQFKFV